MKYGKVIGIGNTSTVYEWGNGKVLKLFNSDYPKEAIEKEFHNAMTIRDMNFGKPKAYEIISCEDKIGIIYDKVEGESLLDWVMKTRNVQECAVYMAKLHKAIIHNTLADLYLKQMNVTREMIQDFLSVIIAVRAGECPNERGYL